jgi:Cu(I)/Ag(I) efflux system membrane fusion protein
VIDVNVRVEGWVRDLVVNVTGQQVSAGQVLFSLYSPDVVATVDEYLLAIRGRAGARQSVVPGAAQQMDDLASAAKRRLTLWGIPSAYITALEMGRRDETVTFSSPMNGIVLEKSAVEGMRVMPGQTLYRIADLSSVWMDADVRESDLPLVRIGADVTVTLDASGGAPIQGRAI